MIAASLQVNMRVFSPPLLSSCSCPVPDFHHQKPDPKNQEFREAFPPAWLEVGLGPLTLSVDKWATCSWQFMSSLQNPQHSFSKPQDGLSALSLGFLSLAIVSFRRQKGCRVERTAPLDSCPSSPGPRSPWHRRHTQLCCSLSPASSPITFPHSSPCSRQVPSSIIQTLKASFALLVLESQIISLVQTFHCSCQLLICFSKWKKAKELHKEGLVFRSLADSNPSSW